MSDRKCVSVVKWAKLIWKLISVIKWELTNWPGGLMDKASVSGAEDWGFESLPGRIFICREICLLCIEMKLWNHLLKKDVKDKIDPLYQYSHSNVSTDSTKISQLFNYFYPLVLYINICSSSYMFSDFICLKLIGTMNCYNKNCTPKIDSFAYRHAHW